MVRIYFKQKRILLGMFVLLAIFAQSLLPVGYMPKLGTGKFFEITICHGAESTTLLVDEHMQPANAESDKNKNHNTTDKAKPCVFASMSGNHLLLQSFLFQQIVHLTYERFVTRDAVQAPQIVTTKSYLAQAPPVSDLIS